jgi:hypothetical protein
LVLPERLSYAPYTVSETGSILPSWLMFDHEPAGYSCPLCFLLAGGETEVDSPRDTVLTNDLATAMVASYWFPNNRGHVIVFPNTHHENIYELPDEYGHAGTPPSTGSRWRCAARTGAPGSPPGSTTSLPAARRLPTAR